jgi:hypothetical protein
MQLKRLILILAGIAAVAAFSPIAETAISGAKLVAQELPCIGDCEENEDTGDCVQDCAPMPASCNGGHHTCTAKMSCTTCVCMARDPNTGRCTTWQEQMQSPKQKTL